MRLYGLIGYPLSHSFSKKYFEEKFEKEKLTDCRFENFPIQSINEIEKLIEANPTLKGLAITIPYKLQVLPYLYSAAGIPIELGACNCVRVVEGRLIGYNTDFIGFEKSITPLLQKQHSAALVFGNGGAAKAVTFVLQQLGITYKIVSRKNHDRASLTYSDLNAEMIAENTLLINTTPLGMYPNVDSCPPIPYTAITPQHLLYDLVYNPAITLFLEKGKERGASIKNGADMLILQAEENWKIWNQ